MTNTKTGTETVTGKETERKTGKPTDIKTHILEKGISLFTHNNGNVCFSAFAVNTIKIHRIKKFMADSKTDAFNTRKIEIKTTEGYTIDITLYSNNGNNNLNL